MKGQKGEVSLWWCMVPNCIGLRYVKDIFDLIITISETSQMFESYNFYNLMVSLVRHRAV